MYKIFQKYNKHFALNLSQVFDYWIGVEVKMTTDSLEGKLIL